MGLCDEASSGGLLRELPGDFIRSGEDQANIEIEFIEDDGEKWIIKTSLKLYEKLNFERVEQTYKYLKDANWVNVDNWQRFPWERIFIAGYGAGLRTDGTADYEQYFSGDAVYTLFKYSQTLQNPELAWRRLQSANGDDKQRIDENISGILGEILDLDENSKVVLEPNGIFIDKDGGKVALGAVGDGYRATTTLIIDLLSWQFLIQNKDHKEGKDWKPLSLDEMSGIVIIDEIEKHLHPLLQRRIINNLVEKFPKIQFIITTHSPLCVSGVSDVSEGAWKIFSSHIEEGRYKITKRPLPTGLRADQILVDYFDLPTTINIKLQEKVERLRDLFMRVEALNPDEKTEMEQLSTNLKKQAPLLAEREEDRELEKESMRMAKELRQQLIKDGLIDDKD